MIRYKYNEEKNNWLKENRNISFNILLEKGIIVDIIDNRSTLPPNQKELIILYENYCYSIPFVIEEDGSYFLKTAHMDRNLNKLYNK